MRKNLLIFICCIGICTCAYRFGDISLKEAKSTTMETLHSGIFKLMLPMVTLYDIPDGYLVCQDIGMLVMPVLGSIGQDELFAYADNEHESLGESEGTEAGEKASDEIPTSVATDSQTHVSEKDTDSSEIIEPSENAGPEEPSVEIGLLNGLEKKVVINRQKLQDFDYLKQTFYQVDNSTTIGSDLLNVNMLLNKDMTLTEQAEGPQILIYHTHSQEGYQDSVAGDAGTSVVAVGEYLTKLLTETYGIQVLHHTGQYDVDDHADSYAKALPAIKQILAENPSIEVVIDLHRDGVPDSTHLVTEIDGKPTAQIMFFNGLSRTATGELAYLKNPYIEDNLAFSFQMQLAAEEYFPGLARRIYLKGYRYNMHLCPKTLLIEVGAQTNTFEEARNAMEPLAVLLAKVLKTDKVP